MKQQKIIAIIGARRAGKTSFSQLLENSFWFKRVPMAGPLKEMLRVGLGLTTEHTDGDLKQSMCYELCGHTPVEAMQTIGTEWGRNLMGATIWVRRWGKLIDDVPRVSVDDVRFQNEIDAIRERGGIVVRIRRPEVEGKDSHESEMYALELKPDYEILNNSSYEEFMEKCAGLCDKLKLG